MAKLLKYERSIKVGKDGAKYRLYMAEYDGLYYMIAGNMNENLDWGLYIRNKPKLEFPNTFYMGGFSFQELKDVAETYARTIDSENYMTEDGHVKRNCPVCEMSEHVDILDDYGHCELCELQMEML